jgi:signal transduction protein with GAF and PtsI domain
MSPAALPEVRFMLRHSSLTELQQLAQRALSSTEANLTRLLLQDFSAHKLKLR